MQKVQGVNRGEIISSLINGMDMLNTYSDIDTKYNKWYYDSSGEYGESTLTFVEQGNIIINLEKIDEYNYQVSLDNENVEDYTYKWYIDENLQSETSYKITINPSLSERILKVEVYLDDELVGTKKLYIDPETLSIKLLEENNILYVQINSSMEITTDDYTFEWYKKNEEDFEKIEGQTGVTYELIDMHFGDVYKVVATHKTIAEFSKEILYYYGNIVYVNYSETTIDGEVYPAGSDDNNGRSPQTAVQTIEAAYNLLPDDAKAEDSRIVIVGEYKNTISKTTFNKPATITGKDLEKDYSGVLYTQQFILLNAETIFKDLVLNGNNKLAYLYCQGNSITMDEGISMENFANATTGWGVSSEKYPGISIIGGFLNYQIQTEIPESTANIIIKSGYYARILSGSRADGSPGEVWNCDLYGTYIRPAKVNITIDIKEELDSNYDAHIGLIVGGQSDGSCFMNNKINIENGTINKIIGGNLGYNNSSIESAPRDSFFGSTTININGGEVEEIYGGSLGRNGATAYFYGKITFNINGGIINNNVYGTGAGGTTGYSENSTDVYKYYALENEQEDALGKTMQDLDGNEFNLKETEVKINISDNAQINGSVYGGGYGYSEFLEYYQISEDGGALYGNIDINITGGKITGSVYGGGRGTSIYGSTRSKLACVIGDIAVNISGNPEINGNIYGASEGISGTDYVDMAEVTGNINVNIEGNTSTINGDIYGCGSIAKTEGNVTININSSTLNNIYGGGNAGSVSGEIAVNIINAKILENIFGGGYEGAVYGSTQINIKETEIGTTTSDSNVFGGGKGSTAIVDGTAKIDIASSQIYGNVFGGGDSGDVYGDANVKIYQNTNVTEAVYGGGNNANIGKSEDETASTYVNVFGASVGIKSGTMLTGGEVFGGGNYGKVYGDTIAIVGSIDEEVVTKIGSQFYAGGRGESSSATTVYRKFKWYNSRN